MRNMKTKKQYSVISVIVPIHVFPEKIKDVRNSILKATTPIEIIYVVDKNVSDFIENIKRYLKKNGFGIIMVKARSIDVSLEPKKAFDLVCSKLESNEFKIMKKINLLPYEKDHAAIMISI